MNTKQMHFWFAPIRFNQRFSWRLLLLWATVATAAMAQPAITLSTSNGPPTTKLLVSGSGFDPYSAVDVYFDTKDEALAVTDGNGSFGQIGITVPGSPKPGGHWVTGVERNTGFAGQSHFLVNTDWAQFHFVPDLSGFNPYENVLNPSNVPRMGLRWRRPIGRTMRSSPAVVNGIVYVGSDDGNLYALDARTGMVVWKHLIGQFAEGAPAVAYGVVYLSYYSQFYALDARTGVLLWSYDVGGQDHITDSPTVANGLVYFGTWYGSIFALDAGTGALRWHSNIHGATFYDSPAVADGRLYIGSNYSFVYALDASTGTVLWSYPTTAYVDSSPVVADAVLYFISGDGKAYAFDTHTGSELWERSIGEYLHDSSPAVANGILYFGANSGTVYALDASDGSLRWKYTTGAYVTSSPAVANGVVYVGSWDNNVYALNATTGTLLWRYATGNVVDYSSPAVSNGAVFVGSEDGTVYAFDLSVGADSAFPPEPRLLVPDLRLKPSGPN